MKRLLFLVATVLVNVLSVGADTVPPRNRETVTQQEALPRAAQFLAARYDVNATGGMRQPRKNPQLQAATLPESLAAAQTAFYVFNVGSAEGFVIVSADDRAPEILGYADSGSFVADSLPDNFRAFLNGYAEEMQCLSSNYSPNTSHLHPKERLPSSDVP